MKSIYKCILFFSLVCLPAAALAGTDLPASPPVAAGSDIAVADTAYGKVRGYVHGGSYIYKGIPYARADRFMPPAEPDAWQGIRSAMAWGPVCPLMLDRSIRLDEVEFMYQYDWGYEDEDCQVLNIWTPSIGSEEKRPVMVWIHGGAYTFGSSQHMPLYDGERLSEKGDVVVVSINHRLNVLGFADLSAFGEKYRHSANVGMMDLVAALEWIKENIANFGGDPGNVTLFGQSGGGGKVGTLMYAPSARGLFHKAVIQSGGDPRFQDPGLTQRIGAALVRELGIETDRIDDIQAVPYDELAAAAERALGVVSEALAGEGTPPQGYGFGFSPCLDGVFLPYAPTDERALALSRDIPLLIGSTKHEVLTSMWSNPPLADTRPETVEAFVRKTYGEKTDAFMAAVKKAYPEDADPAAPIDVDTLFRQATVAQADREAADGRAPVFMYLFTWTSPVLDGRYKSVHCMELPFVFNNVPLAEEMTGGGAAAHVLAHRISMAWINFARMGDPNHDGLPRWPAYTRENGNTMILDNTCGVRQHHDRELLEVTAGGTSLW